MKVFSHHKFGVWVFANSIDSFSDEQKPYITGNFGHGEDFFAPVHKFVVLEDGDYRDVRLYRVIDLKIKTIAFIVTEAVPNVCEDIGSVIDGDGHIPLFFEKLLKSGEEFDIVPNAGGEHNEAIPFFVYDHQKGTIRDFVIKDYDYFIDGKPVSKKEHEEFVGRATKKLHEYAKQMTLAEIEKALGYKVEIV